MRKFGRRFFCAVFAVFLGVFSVVFFATHPVVVRAQQSVEAVPSKQTFDETIVNSARNGTYPLESATLYTTGSQVGGIGAMFFFVQD